jgi:hypothetical protein
MIRGLRFSSMNYTTAGTHKTVLIAQLASLLVLRSPTRPTP